MENGEIQNANTSDKIGMAHKSNTTENRQKLTGMSEGATVYSQGLLLGLGWRAWVCSCEENLKLRICIKYRKVFSIIMPKMQRYNYFIISVL